MYIVFLLTKYHQNIRIIWNKLPARNHELYYPIHLNYYGNPELLYGHSEVKENDEQNKFAVKTPVIVSSLTSLFLSLVTSHMTFLQS